VKPRELPRAAAVAPPPELRQFTDPSRPGHQGADLGVNVYPDRAAWLAARQAWAAGHGKTVSRWWDDLMEEVRRDMREGRCTLGEANDMFRFDVEDDDFTDPRLTACHQDVPSHLSS